MSVHKTRVKTESPISSQEVELDNTIRKWKRTPETDPYKFGLETLASRMKSFLKNYTVKTAYNEFCYPSIADAVVHSPSSSIDVASHPKVPDA